MHRISNPIGIKKKNIVHVQCTSYMVLKHFEKYDFNVASHNFLLRFLIIQNEAKLNVRLVKLIIFLNAILIEPY